MITAIRAIAVASYIAAARVIAALSTIGVIVSFQSELSSVFLYPLFLCRLQTKS